MFRLGRVRLCDFSTTLPRKIAVGAVAVAAVAAAVLAVVGADPLIAAPTHARAASGPSTQPPGTIFFTRGARRGLGDEYWDIYALPAAGGPERPIAASPRSFEGSPAPSPDGRRLAFVRGGALAMIIIATHHLQVIDREGAAPAWSMNGLQLAYVHDPTLKSAGLYVARLDRLRPPRRLTRSDDLLPNWSPNNRMIATVSSDVYYNAGTLRIIGVRDGRTIRTRRAIGQLKWSPNGTMSLYATRRGLFVADALARHPKRIGFVAPTSIPAGSEYAWSPDGRTIAYTAYGPKISTPSGFDIRSTRIRLIRHDGRGSRVLTRGIADHFPVWSPDGRYLAFLRGRQLWVMRSDGSNRHMLARRDIADIAWSRR